MNPKQKLFFTIAIAFCIFAASVFFGIVPLVQGIGKDAKNLATQRHALDEFQKEVQERERFAAFLQENEKTLQGIELLFIDHDTPIPFIEFVEQSSQDFGLVPFITLEGDTAVQKSTRSFLAFRIVVQGPYPAVFGFLSAVENAPFALELAGLTIHALQQSADKQFMVDAREVETTMTVNVYTQ